MHTAASTIRRKAHGFDERAHGARGVRMAQQDPVDAGRQHLLKHPCVSPDRRFIGAVHRHVDDDRRRQVSAFGRAALHQAAHVVAQPPHVEGGVLHVVTDVVSVRLGVLHPLLEVALGAFVGPCVVDRLPLLEKFDRPVDVLRFGGLGMNTSHIKTPDQACRRDGPTHHDRSPCCLAGASINHPES